MKELKPLYLDRDGYDKLLQQIDDTKEAIRKNNSERKSAFDAGAGDGWDSPEFEEIERVHMRLTGELNSLYADMQRTIIIEKHNDDDIIDIGDVIVSDMIFSEDDKEELTFKLVGANGNLKAEIQEISINSPLGSSVYKKRVGDTCSYSVNGRSFSVYLKQKLDLTKVSEASVQKVKK